ncbi:MAG: hypothetical protein ACRC92_06500 [Peptostreptococcaceae bacterium]
MGKSFVNIVQKCICIDFLLNALINSNSYEYLNFLNSMRDENLKNIKVICHMYEYIYKDKLILEDIPSVQLGRDYKNSLDTLVEYSLNIITELEYLKHHPLNHNFLRLLQNLINSYFNFISLINCLYTNRPPNSSSSTTNNNIFFNLIGSYEIKYYKSPLHIDLIRKICIEAVNLFFNYSLQDNTIDDEYYEIFFKNSPENKFYQYYFKSTGNVFKIRILDSTSNIFYIYRCVDNPIETINSLNKENAKILVDSYLMEKFQSNYNNLCFDEEYLNVSYSDKSPEIYKFKYIYNTINNKLNLNNSLYITVDAKSMIIKEISVL